MRAARVLSYRPEDIYERDGWRCGICRTLIDQSLGIADAMGKTIDHIIPLSRGGIDAPSNVQAAHRWCNSMKGDRIGEPTPLPGRPLAIFSRSSG